MRRFGPTVSRPPPVLRKRLARGAHEPPVAGHDYRGVARLPARLVSRPARSPRLSREHLGQPGSGLQRAVLGQAAPADRQGNGPGSPRHVRRLHRGRRHGSIRGGIAGEDPERLHGHHATAREPGVSTVVSGLPSAAAHLIRAIETVDEVSSEYHIRSGTAQDYKPEDYLTVLPVRAGESRADRGHWHPAGPASGLKHCGIGRIEVQAGDGSEGFTVEALQKAHQVCTTRPSWTSSAW